MAVFERVYCLSSELTRQDETIPINKDAKSLVIVLEDIEGPS